jgi:cell division protein FtsB
MKPRTNFTDPFKTTKTIFWVVVFILAVIGIVVTWKSFGRWITLFGGGLLGLFGGADWLEQKEQERIKQRNLEIREDIENQNEIRTKLDSETEDWREKVDKLRRNGLVIIIPLCLGLFLTMLFSAAVYAKTDNDIPETYDELLEEYILALEYIDEAGQKIAGYQALDDRRIKTIEKQADRINELEQEVDRLSRPTWGVVSGLEVIDMAARWKLGISKQYNGHKSLFVYSWSAGLAGGGNNGLGIFSEVELRWKPP